METLTAKLEALMVPLMTFMVAVMIMGSSGGLGSIELMLGLVQAVAAYMIWTRWAAPR